MRWSHAIAPLSLLLLAFPAGAMQVDVEVTGRVVHILQYDDGLVDDSIALGTPFSLHATYDDAAPPLEDAATFDRWIQPVPPNDISMSVGNYTATPGTGAPCCARYPVGVWITLHQDSAPRYSLFSIGDVTSNVGYPVWATFSVDLAFDSLDAVQDLANVPFDERLPLIDVVAAQGSLAQLDMSSWDGAKSATIRMEIDSFAVTAPEPGAASLGALAVALTLAARRRSR